MVVNGVEVDQLHLIADILFLLGATTELLSFGQALVAQKIMNCALSKQISNIQGL